MIFHVGQMFEFKNGTIARFISYSYPEGIKIRCVRPCNGTRGCDGERKGFPYTYQQLTTEDNIKKRLKRVIGTEELLTTVFNNIKQKKGDVNENNN